MEMNEVDNDSVKIDSDKIAIKSKSLPWKIKTLYGTLDAPVTSVTNMIGFYLLYFMTDVVGIGPAVAGTVFTAAVVWDAISDPAMGIISDRTTSRFGRRRPYIIAAAIPYCIIAWLIFAVPPLEGTMLVIYFAAMLMILYTIQTILFVPFSALAPEMTTDYDERTSLATSRTFWSNTGGMVGGALPLLIVAQFSDAKTGWFATAGIFALFYIFPILVTWNSTRGWEKHSVDTEPFNFKEVVTATLGNRTFRYVTLIYLLGASGMFAGMSVMVYFLQYLMGFSEQEVSYYFIFLYLVSIATVPIVPLLSKKIGKRKSCIVLFLIWGLGSGILAMVMQPGQLILAYLMGVFGAIGANAVYQLSWAMIPDAIEVDEFKTGKRREGLFYAVANFTLKLGTAVAVFLVGQSLEIIGYVPNQAQSATTLFGFRIMLGGVVAVLLLLAIFMALKMPMNRERHKALLEAIECKKNGKPYDEESIKELL